MNRYLTLGLLACVSLGCQSLSGTDDLEIATQSDAAAGSGGSPGADTSGMGGSAGVAPDAGTGGGGQTCSGPDECPGTENDCAARTCVAGKCGMSFAPDNQALSAQITGDCHETVCDGAGKTKDNVDDLDVKDDGNECTLDQCENGNEKHSFASATTQCGTGSATHCDGSGNCVGCTGKPDCPADTQCATWACSSGTCTQVFMGPTALCGSVQSCSGGAQTNADKCNGGGACTDMGTTSCGAYSCAATACNTSCTSAAQCSTGNYCGGGGCKPKKTDGTACASGSECLKGFCVDGVCCDTACNGTCEACTAAKTLQSPNGSCAAVANMTDPDNECAAGRVCVTSSGATEGQCSGIKQCDCSNPSKGDAAFSMCCDNSANYCSNCPDNGGACAPQDNTPCAVGVPSYGYMGPGWGLANAGASCQSGVVCATWKCDCVP